MIPENKDNGILALLREVFATAPRSAQVQRMFDQPLSVFVVEREDRNLCYLTDGRHTIMGLASRRREEVVRHPCNNIKKNFYLFQEKTYLYLNYTQDHPCPQDHEMHPYTPQFYFKERYDDFVGMRSTLKLKSPCQMLQLTKWEFALVNIQHTGYYAPIIVMHEQKKQNSRHSPDYMNLNCILYEPKVQSILEAYRLDDMKDYFETKREKTKISSLFYQARHMTLSSGRVENNHIVALDHDQKILICKSENKHAFVLTSDFLDGVCSITNPAREKISPEEVEKIKTKHLNYLFNGLNLENQQAEDKEERPRQKAPLWSDSESSGEEYEPSEKLSIKQIEYESSQEEDPLRSLYKKMIGEEK